MPGKFKKTVLRITLLSTAALLLIIGLGGFWLYAQLLGSLPVMTGDVPLAGLSAPVTIDRDNLGVVTIRAENRLDVARATGFIHAQDRFFQMDGLRRSATGELAEWVGATALQQDRKVRIHQFRQRARDVLAHLPESDQALVKAYTAGVNAGLAALDTPPFEYLLLRATPAPWVPEDTLLGIYAMYLRLQGNIPDFESAFGVLRDTLHPELVAFLNPLGTPWDAPLQGEAYVMLPPPGPDIVDLRKRPISEAALSITRAWGDEDGEITGSNNWAVAGSYTVHGSALLADDMHLGLGIPNIWYRVAFIYPDEQGIKRRVVGVTLPGVPVMVVGSNGRIAWGFTNSQGDWADLVELELDPADVESYLTPQGPRRFQQERENIAVKNAAAETLDIRSTVWGPVYDTDHQGRLRALRWVAHDREAVNLESLRLETASDVTQALTVAARSGLPGQNLVVADAEGHIGWTLMGPIPRRFGHDGRVPKSWADGSRGWDGWVKPEDYPRIVDPPQGKVWTANARVVSGDWLKMLGFGGYRLGARAKQIRDSLLPMAQVDESDMLALQLDDRALFLARWRDLLLQTLDTQALDADPRRRAMRHHIENWGGRAAVESVGYRLVREFRLAVAQRALQPLTAVSQQADARFDFNLIRRYEGPLWQLVSKQPAHLLAADYPDWPALFLAAVDDLLTRLADQNINLAQYTWGAYNTSRIQHPFSRAIPIVGRWLDMPAIPLPGDSLMPRVQQPAAGASQRMVVAPGHEEQGIFHMPGGQSGHPLSPHYRDSHAAWIEGQASPFLPGPAVHTLRLLPVSPVLGENP